MSEPVTKKKRHRSILPITGKGLWLVRAGRVLIEIDELHFGTPGVTVIIGHNGSGKSLLLKLMTGLIAPDSGEVLWNDQPPQRPDYHRLGYMKQNPVLLRRSVSANLEFAFRQSGLSKSKAHVEARSLLAEADLSHLAETSARALSGGERQHVSLLRMLAANPEITVLDEPTSSLDPAATKQIEKLILELKQKGQAILLVTHDLGQAKRLADHVLFVQNGIVVERGHAKAFFNKPKSTAARAFIAGTLS